MCLSKQVVIFLLLIGFLSPVASVAAPASLVECGMVFSASNESEAAEESEQEGEKGDGQTDEEEPDCE